MQLAGSAVGFDLDWKHISGAQLGDNGSSLIQTIVLCAVQLLTLVFPVLFRSGEARCHLGSVSTRLRSGLPDEASAWRTREYPDGGLALPSLTSHLHYSDFFFGFLSPV